MANMDIGMVGMAVMGSNLALNMADHGYQVACYNYTPDLTEKFVKEHPHENAHPFYDLKAFVASLKKPRKIMMMIMAGKPVDSMIEQLIPLLDKGDIIIDGGNSFFGDTMRRYDTCKAHGLNFFGTGISGGETGARRGPCIMPGGDKAAYASVQPIFEAIAAKAEGAPCCTYIGESGAGHFVKMVHNGIEYADMQLIAESYLLLKYAGGFQNDEIAKIFRTWNEGEHLCFSISDDGQGIKKENVKKVFDKFYRVHTGNVHDVKGFGLGLAYVKEIINLHDGEIKCESELGKGTKFTVKLPILQEN